MHIDRVIVGNKVDGMMHAVDIWVHYVKNASKKIKVPYIKYMDINQIVYFYLWEIV